MNRVLVGGLNSEKIPLVYRSIRLQVAFLFEQSGFYQEEWQGIVIDQMSRENVG